MVKLFLFLLLPFLELYSLIALSDYITGFGVILYVIVAGMLGVWIIKAEGQQGLFSVRQELQAGRVPEEVLFDKLFIFLAGVCFVIPGVLTDIFAVLLLFPPSRHVISSLLVKRLNTHSGFRQGFAGGNGAFFFHSTQNFSQPPPTTVVYDCTVTENTELEDAPLTIDCESPPSHSADTSSK